MPEGQSSEETMDVSYEPYDDMLQVVFKDPSLIHGASIKGIFSSGLDKTDGLALPGVSFVHFFAAKKWTRKSC